MLSSQQQQAILYLLQGHSKNEVASKINRSEASLNHWMANNAEYRRTYDLLKGDIISNLDDLLGFLYSKIPEKLDQLLESKSDATKLKTIECLLKHGSQLKKLKLEMAKYSQDDNTEDEPEIGEEAKKHLESLKKESKIV